MSSLSFMAVCMIRVYLWRFEEVVDHVYGIDFSMFTSLS